MKAVLHNCGFNHIFLHKVLYLFIFFILQKIKKVTNQPSFIGIGDSDYILKLISLLDRDIW